MPIVPAIYNGGASLEGPSADGTSGQPLTTDGSGALSFAGNTYTDAEQTKVGYLTVTGAVDLDAIDTRVNALDSAIVLKGTWDASSGSFPGSGSAQAGESWIVSVAGTVDSVAFAVDDRVIAISDNASTSSATDWHKADYTDLVQSVAGLTGAITAADLADAIESELSITESQISDFDSSDYLPLTGGQLSGNLGIGVSPGKALDVDGDIRVRGDSGKVFFYRETSPIDIASFGYNNTLGAMEISANNKVMRFLNLLGSAESMRITSDGDVGIGETSPDYTLDVNGSIGFTPGDSVTPADNGDVVFEFTNNTTLTVRGRGTDGTVRSGTVTLA